MIKDNMMLIRGCLPYRTRKEKKAAWRQLKKEFDNNVKIEIEDQYITYSAKVERGLFF